MASKQGKEKQCHEQRGDRTCELLSAISALITTGAKALSESERKEVIEAAYRLQEALETTEEKVFRIMSMPNDATALGIAADMDLFDITARYLDSTGEVIRVSDLAAMSGADVHFLARILRFLAGHSLMIEVAEDHYQITDAGRLLLNDQPLGGMVLAMSMSLLPLGNMLQYFRKHGCERGPWQDAHHSDQSFFQWLKDKPKEKKAFHLAMAGLRPNAACQWFEHFRVREKLLVSGNRVSLVDVGGGMGHDAKRLVAYCSEMKDKVCVLDLPNVVRDSTAHEGIQFVGHDFFYPYPAEVRGAKAYYMRMILHDWPEKQAKSILENVRQAMSKDSLLLAKCTGDKALAGKRRVSLWSPLR